jgi:hypothetical protein
MVPKSISSWWRATRVRDVLGVRLTGRPMKGWLLVDAGSYAEDDDIAAGSTGASPYTRWLRASNRASHQASVRG